MTASPQLRQRIDQLADEREVLIRETCRTGVQTVEREGDRYFVTIKNRTYASEHEISIEAARRFYTAMRKSAIDQQPPQDPGWRHAGRKYRSMKR